jgi:hypothetical protein
VSKSDLYFNVQWTNLYFFLLSTEPEEYPTLLHFAAKWGLERLCLQLLDCPGSGIACEMRNVSGKNPAELAEASGHEKLAASCRDFSVN